MCGRYSLTATPEEVAEYFGTLDLEAFPPRYNIAPTQAVLAIMAANREPGSNLPGRAALLVRWGLIPSWLKATTGFPLLINARSETAATKNSFRGAMRHHRALFPASGFYEWRRDPEKKRKSQAYWVRPRGGGLTAFAGLVEHWMGPDGSEIDTGAILTADANAEFAAIHDRMPVVIPPEHFDEWLDCKGREPRDVAHLLKAPEPGAFEAIPVSDLVNKVANTGPEVQAPISGAGHIDDTEDGGSKTPKPQKPGGQLDLL